MVQRTTSKEFREQIQKHINDINTKDSVPDMIAEWLIERPPTKNESSFEGFNAWCQGLPTAFEVLFETFKVKKELNVWFNAVDLEFDEDRVVDAMEFYIFLMFREIRRLHPELKVHAQ